MFLNPEGEGKEIFARFLFDPQSQNSYSYGNNNPIMNSDPSGKNPAILILGFFFLDPIVGSPEGDLNPTPQQFADAKNTKSAFFIASLMVPGEVEEQGFVKTGKFISKNFDSVIQITKERLGHIIKRHAWNSTEEVSTFLKGVDPVKLVNKASEITGTVIESSKDKLIRIIHSQEEIGFDYLTNQTTNTYTVITKLLKNGKEKLITIYPGLPKL